MATQTFNATGAVQTWVVPANVTAIVVECWGAQGGQGTGSGAGNMVSDSGKGGYSKGTLAVTPGETLRVYVGVTGAYSASSRAWNGGGTAGSASTGTATAIGGHGGGASDVRQGGTSLSTRKIVAAGGAGASRVSGDLIHRCTVGDGGDGGANTGETGTAGSSGGTVNGGGGGTQSAGGSGGGVSNNSEGQQAGTNGSTGSGGAGGDTAWAYHHSAAGASYYSAYAGGGGGGGWRGGGGGGAGVAGFIAQQPMGFVGSGAGGGGGSNYVGGVTSTTTTRGIRSGSGLVRFTYYRNPTTPGPFTSPVAGAEFFTTHNVAWGASTDADNDLSHYELSYSVDNGISWAPLVDAFGTSTSLNFSGIPASSTAKLRVRAIDSGGRTSGWRESPTFTVTHNTAPLGPTPLTPANNAILNRSQTQRFSWTFNDPDPGDSQSQYSIIYRVQGTTDWSGGDAVSTNKFHDFAAGTFDAADYEWHVRTKDSYGVWGPFSAARYFTAADAPGDLTVTSPTNNQTISTENSQVIWSTPEQTQFQVRRVADDAGSPDTSTVYYDSGQVSSVNTRSHALNFTTNNRTEHVQVRVNINGLWSEWVSVAVNVDYTEPPVPTFELSIDEDLAHIRLDIINPAPAGSEPAVQYNDIYRRIAGSDPEEWFHRATDVDTNTFWIDNEVAKGTEYIYKVVARGDNGTSSESEQLSTIVDYVDWWIRDPYNHEWDRKIEVEQDDLSLRTPKDIAFFSPLGREGSVSVEDVHRSESIPITIGALGPEEYRELKRILKLQHTLLLQSPMLDEQWYVRIQSPVERTIINMVDPYVQFKVEFVEVEEPDVPR